jgi:HEAT repeat protein
MATTITGIRGSSIAVLATALCAWPSAAAQAAARSCADLKSCLAAVKNTAAPGDGITRQEMALAETIQRYGKAAAPGLLALLADPNANVRALAAYTLRDLRGLTEAETAPLLRALAAGEDWVALALASIGSQAAIAGLLDALAARPDTHTQVTYAFEKLGAKSVPALLGALDCPTRCDQRLLSAIVFIFEELGRKGRDAVMPLAEVAADTRRPIALRRAAVSALGGVGEAAVAAAPSLLRLAASDPGQLEEPVLRALQAMKAPGAAEVLAARLAKDPSVLVLRDIAALGPAGRTAGPAMIPLLSHPDWEVRMAAARALGYVADGAATEALVAALDNQEDWQLVLAAAESLGRLKAKAAVAPLRAVALHHWYPPVRAAARKARSVIAGAATYLSRWHPSNFAFEFFELQDAGSNVPPCRIKRPPGVRAFLPDDDLNRALATVGTYEATIASYGPGEGGALVRIEGSTKQAPETALEVPGGWLLGASRGEWGGELVFTDRSGRQQLLVDDNIDGLARLGHRIVAVGGLAHLSSNRGLAYQVSQDAGGRWSARPWRLLPGAPSGSRLDRDGRWLINTNGGSVLLAPNGALTMATCPAPPSSRRR